MLANAPYTFILVVAVFVTGGSACSTPVFGKCKSNVVQCCPSHQYCQPWYDVTQYRCTGTFPRCSRLLTDMEFDGRDLKMLSPVSPRQCCQACADTPGCKVFTHASLVNECFLKSASGVLKIRESAVAGRVDPA